MSILILLLLLIILLIFILLFLFFATSPHVAWNLTGKNLNRRANFEYAGLKKLSLSLQCQHVRGQRRRLSLHAQDPFRQIMARRLVRALEQAAADGDVALRLIQADEHFEQRLVVMAISIGAVILAGRIGELFRRKTALLFPIRF